jgi:phosphatidylserine/phosphatidylglycerophosphate/cardiolipin synthase-like enzyme
MDHPILCLLPSDLRALAAGLRTGHLCPPYPSDSVQRMLNRAVAAEISTGLQELAASGLPPAGIACALELLAMGYESRPPIEDVVDLVTTGGGASGAGNRTTSVLVGELFRNAQQSVLVAGYAVYQGQKVFQALADRMQESPDLDVRLFLDIQRRHGNTSAPAELVREFVQHFRTSQWPTGRPLPQVFYDPRSVTLEPGKSAALHAKCVVIDKFDLFVSSANFTEAAQQRNIEVGLRLRSTTVAGRIVRFFESLVADGNFERVI